MRRPQAYPDWEAIAAGGRRWGGLPGAGLRRAAARARRFTWVLLLAPTLVAAVYYGAIASDRYVSEARFVIRTASKPAGAIGGLNALLQLVGMSRSQDDAYAVHDYLTSRDALREVNGIVDLRAIYGDPDADFLSRYPNLVYGRSDEDFYLYFQRMLTVVVSSISGLSTMRVDAFRSQDAQVVAQALLQVAEAMVNRLNVRIQEDAVRVAETEVTRAEQRRIANQIAITAFRNRELILDPTKSSAMLFELIGRLSTMLAEVRMQIAETQGNSPNSPQLQSLNQKAAAIERQIAIERGRVANSSDGLAEKIAEYERMVLEREFSVRALSTAVVALNTARTEARRQQLFLERVVEPGLPDEAMMPKRWRMVLTVFGFNVIGLGVVWLAVSGLREHASR